MTHLHIDCEIGTVATRTRFGGQRRWRSKAGRTGERALLVLGFGAGVWAGAFTGAASGEILQPAGRYETGTYGVSSVEIIAAAPKSGPVFVLDAYELVVRKLLLRVSDKGQVVFEPVAMEGFPAGLGEPTAIAASADRLAVAYADGDALAVWIADHAGNEIARVPLQGDYINALAFSPDGTRLVGLIRGAVSVSGGAFTSSGPRRDDPDGLVFMISKIEDDPRVTLAKFGDAALATEAPFRLAGGANLSSAAEPDAIFFGAASDSAWITLSRNNAVARFDLDAGAVTSLWSLGAKDFSTPGNGIDLVADGVAAIGPAEVRGLYMPQGLAVLEDAQGAAPLLVSANTGDDRDASAVRVEDADLDTAVAASLKQAGYSGVLISKWDGDIDGDGEIETPYIYGGRSIAVWSAGGALIWDSGALIEEKTAQSLGPHFNSSAFANTGNDESSEDFGPAPSDVLVTQSGGRRIAIAALRSVGALAVFDLRDPRAPAWVELVSLRNFSVSDEDLYTSEGLSRAGALGPVRLALTEVETARGVERFVLVASQTSGTIDALRLE